MEPSAQSGAAPVALELVNVSKSFETADNELQILNNVDLTLQRGEAAAITGPSGSGKSTLLYIIGLLDLPTAGTVRIADSEPWTLSAAEQATFRNRHLGFIFQDHHLLPQCTVLENVCLPTLATGAPQFSDVRERAVKLLERVGMEQRIDHRPAQLSGGERQRVAVCRALICQPQLLLADEPTGNLDPRTADSVGSLLLEIAREQQATLLCVTHSQELANRFPRHFEIREATLVDVTGQPAAN